MQELNLPSFDFKVKQLNGSHQIFDEFRKKYVQLTPEEWVRQRFLRYIINYKNYPTGLISVERELNINGLKRRPDAVVYTKGGIPIMILEFKAPTVEVDDETFFQAGMYNKKLRVPWLILSNGMEHYVANVDLQTGQVNLLDDIPDYFTI